MIFFFKFVFKISTLWTKKRSDLSACKVKQARWVGEEEEDRERLGGKKRWREFSSCLMDHLSSQTAGAAPVTGAVALAKTHKGQR